MISIETALALKPGTRVICPPDRGDPGYTGLVVQGATDRHETIQGVPYGWITVAESDVPGAPSHIWPPNRLTLPGGKT